MGERADLVREGRGEQQVLALLRQQREHALDVADEAHVEHAIGFVEHEDLDGREVERLLLDVVEQAAGRRDEDVGATGERALLVVLPDAAEDHHRGERDVGAVGADALFHLGGEFTRRGQDERTDRRAAVDGLRGGRGGEAVQDRQREAGRLAGAGLGAGEEVTPGQHGGDRLGLDGCGFGVAVLGDGADDGLGEPE